MSDSRPLGVSFIALFFLIEAILALGIAAFLLLNPSGGPGLATLLESVAVPVAMGSLLAVPPLLTAALSGLIFRGLWEQREWARVASIVVAFLLALTAILAIAFQFAFGIQSTASLALSMIALLVSVGVLLYLLNTQFIASDTSNRRSVATPEATLQPSPSQSQQSAGPRRPDDFVPPPPRAAAVYNPPGQDTTIASQTADPTQKLAAQPAAPAGTQPAAWLIPVNTTQADQKIALYAHQTLTLGRDPQRVDAVLNDPTVSGRHAEIRYEQGRFVLYDLNSTNGTYRGDYRIQRYPLWDGDKIQLGNVMLRFKTTSPTVAKPAPGHPA